MDRYICNKCGVTFRDYKCADSESVVVRRLTACCYICGTNDIGLTEHGKLLSDRRKKIEHLNQINEK